MIRKLRKGFTIVELVIVIAVIAVLTAVLIPTFVHLSKKANKASDSSLVANLNTALAMEASESGKAPKTMHEAVEGLVNQGYSVPQLVTKSSEDLVYSIADNKFYLSDADEVKNASKKADFWKIYNSVPAASEQTYSIYAGPTFEATEVEVKVGFDAGYKTGISSVSFIGGNDVIIRTNGGTLTIDAASNTVNHYGEGQVLDIQAIAGSSYHEYGYFPKATIKQGRIVVEEQGQIQVLDASGATAAVTIEQNGSGEVANVVKGDNANVTVAEDLTENIATMTTVTTWSALKTEVESGSNKVIAFNASNDENNLATISISRSVIIFGNGKTMSANFNTALSETTTYKGRYDGLFNITGSNIEVLIDNVNLKQNGSKGTALNINEVANNTNVTYTNSTLGSKQYVIATDISNNSHNLRLENVSFDITSFNSIYWRTSNSNIVANNCAFCATVQNSAGTGSNTFGVIVICEPFYKQMNNTTADYLMQNNTITLNGGTIVAKDKALDTTAEIAIYSSYNNKVYLNDTNYNEYTTMFVIVKHNIKSSSYANNSEPTFESSTGSFIYINGESADGKLNVHHCVMYPNNNYAGGNIPCFAGTTTQNPSTYYDGQDYRPLYGYEIVNNGNGTWTYRKAS